MTYKNGTVVFKCILFCIFFSSTAVVYAQSGFSKAEAAKLASVALQEAKSNQKIKTEKEWGNDTNAIRLGDLSMRFDSKIFGNKPVDGRSLYISLHGGGNAPKEVNDQQWKNQHRLYAPAEGVYLVPRAPTNTWNLWHEDHIDDMLDEIIKDAVVAADVNPNKVYILGYSAGGDGVFQLAPRMADRWAAAAMMAGHPGDAAALNLRNLPFAIFMGGVDSAYQRNTHAKEWGILLDSLQDTDTAGFIHDVHIYPGLPHWMNRNDTTAIPWMAGFTRKPLPSKVSWVQDDRHHTRFYWLGTDSSTARTGDTAVVTIHQNNITIQQNTCESLYIYLNDQLLNLDKPVNIYLQDKLLFSGHIKRNEKLIQQTASAWMDEAFIFSARLEIRNGKVIAE